jgi:zinc transport system permease protein
VRRTTRVVLPTGADRQVFSVSNDEEFARAAGLPVVPLNLILAVLTALTVVVAMRVIGVLLVSALMVVPVATAQLVTRSFRSTALVSMALGVVVGLAGIIISFHADTPSGATIVVLAIAMFLVTLAAVGAGRHTLTKHRAPAR